MTQGLFSSVRIWTICCVFACEHNYLKSSSPPGRCDPRGDPEAGGLDNKKKAVGGLEMMLVSH